MRVLYNFRKLCYNRIHVINNCVIMRLQCIAFQQVNQQEYAFSWILRVKYSTKPDEKQKINILLIVEYHQQEF